MLIKKFKDFQGNRIDNLVDYVSNHIAGIGNPKLIVGTDSQEYHGYITYATAICMYNVGNGAHIIYAREKVMEPKYDLTSRLWAEVERTIDIAHHLRENISDIDIDTHFDVNPSDEFKSNIVYKAATGYANGAGFNFTVKPDSYAATCAADRLC